MRDRTCVRAASKFALTNASPCEYAQWRDSSHRSISRFLFRLPHPPGNVRFSARFSVRPIFTRNYVIAKLSTPYGTGFTLRARISGTRLRKALVSRPLGYKLYPKRTYALRNTNRRSGRPRTSIIFYVYINYAGFSSTRAFLTSNRASLIFAPTSCRSLAAI